MQKISKNTLPTVRLNGEVAAYIFDGSEHGNVGSSAFIVDLAAGLGPRRHRHPYDEIFVIVDGTVRLEAGGEVAVATAEDIVVVPAGVPHAFSGAGPGRARLVNIHASNRVVTQFEPDGDTPGQAYEYGHAS
jgi:quercetin dioxygenase-like cupin family protein